MLGMLCILMLYRHCLKRREYAYTKVHHGLDSEEMEFQSNWIDQAGEIDDLVKFAEEEDDVLNEKDLKQIEMLDTYRNHLVGDSDFDGADDVDESYEGGLAKEGDGEPLDASV
jgi:hypothetical protein